MKSLKEHINGIVLCLFELIVGILLLINPISFTTWIIMIAGIFLIILGFIEVVKYFRTSTEEASLGQALAKGLLFLLAGGFCVLKTEWFIVTFPVLTIIYGIIILVTGIVKIQLMADMLRQKNKKWFWAAINAIISIICSIVILKSPFTSTMFLWMFTGASLIVEGILDIVTLIMWKKSSEGKNV